MDAVIIIRRTGYSNSTDCRRIGRDMYADRGEQAGSDRTGGHPADRLSSGGTSASPVIPDTILAVKCIIRMSGTVAVLYLTVVPGALVLVLYEDRDGRAGRPALKYAG